MKTVPCWGCDLPEKQGPILQEKTSSGCNLNLFAYMSSTIKDKLGWRELSPYLDTSRSKGEFVLSCKLSELTL